MNETDYIAIYMGLSYLLMILMVALFVFIFKSTKRSFTASRSPQRPNHKSIDEELAEQGWF